MRFLLQNHGFRSVVVLFSLQLVGTATAEETGAPTALNPLTETEQARYDALRTKKLHELKQNAVLAEYIQLRKRALRGVLPLPEQDLIHFASMGLGQAYRMNAWMSDLMESDCFTFTEKCIAMSCTDSWEAAYKLQNRLRYAGGRNGAKYLNREPVAEWIPNNQWLLDDVTPLLGAPLQDFEVRIDRQKLLMYHRQTSNQEPYPSDETVPGEEILRAQYIPKSGMALARNLLKPADLVFFVGNYSAPPIDRQMRPRCIHMAILEKDPATGDLYVLHSAPPAVKREPLSKWDTNSSMLGYKFARLKPDARALVAAEFIRIGIVLDKTPEQKDREVAKARGELFELPASHPPDGFIVINGRQHAIIRTREGETLWGLLRGGWKTAYDLQVNYNFRARNPDPNAIAPGSTIYIPLPDDGQN